MEKERQPFREKLKDKTQELKEELIRSPMKIGLLGQAVIGGGDAIMSSSPDKGIVAAAALTAFSAAHFLYSRETKDEKKFWEEVRRQDAKAGLPERQIKRRDIVPGQEWISPGREWFEYRHNKDRKEAEILFNQTISTMIADDPKASPENIPTIMVAKSPTADTTFEKRQVKSNILYELKSRSKVDNKERFISWAFARDNLLEYPSDKKIFIKAYEIDLDQRHEPMPADEVLGVEIGRAIGSVRLNGNLREKKIRQLVEELFASYSSPKKLAISIDELKALNLEILKNLPQRPN